MEEFRKVELAEKIDLHCTPEMKEILNEIIDELERKDKFIRCQANEIISLKNEVTDLEMRITEQERYSSKDCLILENAPIDHRNNLFIDVPKFFKQYLNFDCRPADLKAVHPINKGNSTYPPSIIVKFIYFGDKNELYHRRTLLAGVLNPNNRKPIYVKERLPKRDLNILKEAKDQGYITSTYNCQVKVFCKGDNGSRIAVPVNSVRALTDLKPRAISNQERSQYFRKPGGKSVSQPIVEKSSRDGLQTEHESFLKRVRESEGGAQTLQLLNDHMNAKKANFNSTPPGANFMSTPSLQITNSQD